MAGFLVGPKLLIFNQNMAMPDGPFKPAGIQPDRISMRNGIPYFPRQIIQPPSTNREGRPLAGIMDNNQTQMMLHWALNHGVDRTVLTTLQALREKGSVAKFPGGIGLVYDRIFKGRNYDEGVAETTIRKIAKIVGNTTGIVVLTAQNSGVNPARHLAEVLQAPLVEMVKNGVHPGDSTHLTAMIDSYTGKGQDIFSLDLSEFEGAVNEALKHSEDGTVHVAGADDMLDTGTMFMLMAHQISELVKKGWPIQFEYATALLEKEYTGGRRILQEELGINPITGLVAQDIGTIPVNSEESLPWIKIPEIPYAVPLLG